MKQLSFFEKWFGALGFALILQILYNVSRSYLRAANFELVNPFVKGLSYVVGYYELYIIGIPLLGGFLVGLTAVWFYTEGGRETPEKTTPKQTPEDLKC